MTTFTVPRTLRPIDETMFADLGVPLVAFTATPGGGQTVDCPSTLSPAAVLRGRIRLLTVDTAQEATLVAAVAALAADDTATAADDVYLAIPAPTAAQAIPQVRALTVQARANTVQLKALIAWVGRDVLQMP